MTKIISQILLSLITILTLIRNEYRYQTKQITKTEYILSFLIEILLFALILLIL